jgi:hypothetical protein
MGDLGTTTVGATTTLLAVYVAGLIFAGQHVADRHSPLVVPALAREVGKYWLLALGLLAAGALAIDLVHQSGWTNCGDAAVIIATISTALGGLFHAFSAVSDRRRIVSIAIGLAATDDRETALRDMTWNAANRGDITLTEMLLKDSRQVQNDQNKLLEWITQYSSLLEQSWLRLVVVSIATEEPFDDDRAESMTSPIRRLLITALENGWYETAEGIVHSTIRAIDNANSFGEHHGYLLFDIGFALHCEGEEGRSSEREGNPPVRLESVQEWFDSKLIMVRRAAIAHHDAASVTNFCYLINRFAWAGIAPEIVMSQVWDVIEESYKYGALEWQAVESLADTLGQVRMHGRRAENDEQALVDEDVEMLDEYTAHLALYAVAMGRVDQVPRLVGNARAPRLRGMPRRLLMSNDLGEDYYQAVAEALGLKRWPA